MAKLTPVDYDPFSPERAPAQPKLTPVDHNPFQPETPRAPSSLTRRVVGDTAVDLGRGIIGVGEAAVGLANIPTFGYAGKGLEKIGYDPERTKEMIGEFYSPERKEANQEVEQAEGFMGTVGAMLRRPSTIAGAVVESAPSILGGGAIARGAGMALSRSGNLTARMIPQTTTGRMALAAGGEGAVAAGGAAEGIRQQTDDGLLTGRQVAASIGTGATTAGLGLAGGRLASRLGVGDVDMLAAGAGRGVALADEGLRPGIVGRVTRGAISEGLFEEMPQSATEQMWENFAMDRPLGEGVPEASAAGVLTGAAMGGTVGAVSRDGTGGQLAEPVAPGWASDEGPTSAELVAAVRQQMQAQRQTDGTVRLNSRMLARAWGVPQKDVRAAIASAPRVEADLLKNTTPQERERKEMIADDAPQQDAGNLTAILRQQQIGQLMADIEAAETPEDRAAAEAALAQFQQQVAAFDQGATDGNDLDASPAPVAQAGDGVAAGGEALPGSGAQLDGDGNGDAGGSVADVPADLAGAGATGDAQPALTAAPLALPPPGPVTVDAQGNATTAAQADASAREREALGLTPDVLRAQELRNARQSVTYPDAAPGSLADAANAVPTLLDGSPVPDPTGGPLSRAVNEGVASGAVPTTQQAPMAEPMPEPVADQPEPSADTGLMPGVRMEPLGEKGLLVHGDVAAIRERLAEAGFRKKGRNQNGALRFDAKDRDELEVALAQDAVPQPRRQWKEMTGPDGRPVLDSQGRPRKEPVLDYSTDTLVHWLAANGGVNFEQVRAQGGADPALMRDNSVQRPFGVIGMPALRRNGGMSLDEVRERMQQSGWLPEDDPNSPPTVSDNDALDLIMDAINGREVYHPYEGAEARLMREAAERDAQPSHFGDALLDETTDENAIAAWEDDFAPFAETLGREPVEDDIGPAYTVAELMEMALDLGAHPFDVHQPSNRPQQQHARVLWDIIKELSDGTDLGRVGETGRRSDPAPTGRPATAVPSSATRPGEAGSDAEPSGRGANDGGGSGGNSSVGDFQLAGQNAQPEQVAQPASQSGLFAPPTRGEMMDAEIARRDAERNGQTGMGRTDMMAGDGELFAGPRPEQADIEQQSAPNLSEADAQVNESAGTLPSPGDVHQNAPESNTPDPVQADIGDAPRQQLGRGEGQRDPGTLYGQHIVTDADGTRYMVLHARHHSVTAVPLVEGQRPEVSRSGPDVVRFNLNPNDTLEAGERAGPLFDTGKVYDLNALQEKDAPRQQRAAKSGKETFQHNGVTIYPTNVKGVGERWAVQIGDKPGLGDTLHTTVEEARKEADLLVRRRADDARREATASAERAAAEKLRADSNDTDGFADDLPPMQRQKVIDALNHPIRREGVIVSRKNLVRELVANGYTVGEVDGKPVLRGPDGTWLEQSAVTKTAIDYARHLIAKRAAPTSASNESLAEKPAPPKVAAGVTITAHGMFGMGQGASYRLVQDGKDNYALAKPDGNLLTKRYTTEQLLSAWRQGRISIDGNRVDRKSEIAAEKQKKAEAEAKALQDRRDARADEYAKSPASAWIESNLGTDFSNAANRYYLARALTGSDKEYQGLMGHTWIAPLQAIGFDQKKHGDKPADIVRFLRAKFEADSKPATPSAAQETQPTNEAASNEGAEEAAPAALDDFGEKLEGARKHLPPSLAEELGDEQIASQPLSKIWPANAHESIDDDTAAALAFAARGAIPAKPRRADRLRAWVQKVKAAREIVRDPELAREMAERGEQLARGSRELSALLSRARLLSQLSRDTWGRVESVGEYPDAYRHEKGKQVASPFSSVSIDGKRHTFDVGRIGPDEVQKVKELLGTEAPKKGGLTRSDFEIRGPRSGGSAFINRKGDPELRPLKTFTGEDAVKLAREFLSANVAELEAEWEAVKARDNVAKADTRRDQNRERVGENRRDGKDVTEQMFTDAFGFRGVQFGNWVKQGKGAKDRQGLLNEAYDALLDLADILGIPSRAISLNGTMGLSLGARGSGRAAAHFERDNLVINLTKTKGAGSLAHEWFHSLDNYFSRLRGTTAAAPREGDYITYKPEAVFVQRNGRGIGMTAAQLRDFLKRSKQWDDGKTLDENAAAAAGGGYMRDPNHKEGVRPQVEAAFAELVEALNASPMAARARSLDKGRDGYWHRIIERGARSFENYVISKMAQRGWTNDFLANVRNWKEWAELGKNKERYPYLFPEEEAPVVAAFDNLFATIETRTDPETGDVALFNRTARFVPGSRPLDRGIFDRTVERIVGKWKGASQASVRTVGRWADLPDAIQKAAEAAGYDNQGTSERIPGATYRGVVYLVHENITSEKLLEETLFHERVHQVLRGNANDPGSVKLQQALWSLYTKLGGEAGLRRMGKQAGVSTTQARKQADALRDSMRAELAAKGEPAAVAKSNAARAVLMMEEFLADMEGQRAYESLSQAVKRKIGEALGLLRQWLRDNGYTRLSGLLGQDINKTTLADLRAMMRGIRQQAAGTGDGAVRFIRVFHGTPYRGIEKEGFKLNNIGTGEGAQAFGWGMYFAGRREVAEGYRKNLTRGPERYFYDGELAFERNAAGAPFDLTNPRTAAIFYVANDGLAGAKKYLASQGSWGKSVLEALQLLDPKKIRVEKNSGQLYHAEIPEDSDLLDWDKPLSEQPAKVREALEAQPWFRFAEEAAEQAASRRGENATGADIHRWLTEDYTAQEASELLLAAGIPGLRYLDGGSRDGRGDTANYVIWDEALLTPEAAEITPYYSRRDDEGSENEEKLPAARAAGRVTGGSPVFQRSTSDAARELAQELRKEFPGIKLDLMGRAGRVTISRIVLPSESRNAGIGTQVMERIVQWADAGGVTLALTPTADFGGNKARLTSFYKRFGFVDNKGRNKDYEISESMYRPAREGAPVFSRPDGVPSDSDYLAAVERGDMETAQRMVNEAAARAGYQGGADHRMSHRAPNSEDDVSLADVRTSGLVPDDYWTHPHFYMTDPREREAMSNLQRLFRGMDARAAAGKSPGLASITVYRAVPKSVKEGAIRNGDWVSPSEAYARDEGASIPGGYRIISQQVSAKNLWWDGNSAAELGYDDGKGYAYRNTKNNRKLLDAVTRDDAGDVIPLSRRFNARNSDARFSFAGPSAATADTMAPRFLTHAADVQAAVRQVLDGWKGDKPVVRVVQAARELPADARRGEGWQQAEGYWGGGSTVYIVAENNRDVARALEVLSHEAIGHYGIERILGEKEWKRLIADVQRLRGLKQANVSPKVWAALQSAERRYGRLSQNPESNEVFAKEFLAIMAEQGVRTGLTSRVMAAIRRWLAKLGIPMNLTKGFRESELLTALHRGRELVTQPSSQSTRTARAGDPARAMAFARPTDSEVRALVAQYVGTQGAPTEAQIAEAVRQYRETERTYGGRKAWESARDAGRTKLNYGQWVQVRTPNFKRWFGDWEGDAASASKVTDPDTGEPMVVYHGSSEPRTVFEPAWKVLERETTKAEREGSGDIARLYRAAKAEPELHFFAEEEGTAYSYGDTVTEAFLNVRNPAQGADNIDAVDSMLENDNDGAGPFDDTTSSGRFGGLAWVVRASAQIKSATGNVGTFDPASADIRFSRQAAAPKMPSGVGVLSSEQLDVLRQLGLLSQDEEADLSGQQQVRNNEGPRDARGFRLTTARDEDAFLSAFPEAARYGGSATASGAVPKLLERVRQLSERAVDDLGGKAEIERTLPRHPVGPFSGIETRARIKNAGTPQESLVVQVYGKEQIAAGLDEEPALTWTVNTRTGELDVNGPHPERATFREFEKRGWADHARGQDGEIAAGWTALTSPDGSTTLPLTQLMPMLADVHARYRALRKEDRVGLHWSRITGATGGPAGRETAVFFSRPDATTQTPPSGGVSASVGQRLTGAVRKTLDVVDKKTGRGAAKRPDWVSQSVAGKFDTFSGKKPTKQWFDELRDRAGEKLTQRIFDQFRSMRNYSAEGFMQAHLSRATDGTLESVFNYGIPVLKDGAYYIDEKNGGLKGLLAGLGSVEEMQRFFMWIAGNRSERLAGEWVVDHGSGNIERYASEAEARAAAKDWPAAKVRADSRENLFTPEDIKEMKAYSDGRLPDGRNRKSVYDQTLRQFNRFQRAILDIAERAGEIDPESRALWQSDFYLPYYRVAEETGQPFSPGNAGLVRQNVVKRLKGGTEKLGDPLENVLSNWSAMLSASMRNMAANKSLAEAARVGAAERVPSGTKGATWTMVDGKQQHWLVHDPLLLESLEAMNFQGYNNPVMKWAGKFKRALSVGVTVNPSYRIRNLTRDIVSALATADTGDVDAKNPLKSLASLGTSLARGWGLTTRDSDTNIQLMAGGGAVRFGLSNDGDQAANSKRLIAMGINENQILNTPEKVKNAIRRWWDAYQETGNRAETISRAVIYDRAIAAGKSHLEASFEARDLMNFTSMGSSAAVRALAQVLPFFNARLQGLDKLGRAAKNDPRRFWAVAGHVAMASALLYMLQGDDEEYQALPDYVRDTYWPVKLGGTWVYIPKPFELGSLGTVVERGAELMMAGDDYQAKDFRDSMVSILTNTLAMNPVPQIVKPAGEAWFNYDMFRNAPIDSMAQERLLPQDRYTARTSGAAVLAGRAAGVSPQKIEHMVKGYLGWIGIQALNVGDWLARDFAGMPSNPNRDLTSVNNWLVAGDFVKEAGSTPSKYLERFYESQKALDQIYATATQARRAGDTERALELLNDPALRMRPAFKAADRRITRINQSIRRVTADRSLSATEKNRRLENLRKQREEVARRVDRLARAAG